MKNVTLCFLVKVEEVCLAMKKRGFGQGKWNGVGGKVEDGETISEAVLREIHEEIGVKVAPNHLKNVGNIQFYFNDKPERNQHMHIFMVYTWDGEPAESEEVFPKWYDKRSLPFEMMWVDDPHWIPKVMAGKKVEGKFYFNGDGGEIDRFEIKELV